MAAYIEIEGQKIKKGIFHFVFEATGHEDVADLLFEMEKNRYTNRKQFSQEMRHVLEKFSYCEFCRMYGLPYDPSCSPDRAREILKEKILEKSKTIPLLRNWDSPVKAFLVWRCYTSGNLSLFDTALRYWRENNTYEQIDIKKAINACYAFACSEHHENPPGINSYDPHAASEHNCDRWFRFLFHFLYSYCLCYFPDKTSDSLSLNFQDIPYNDYVPVPQSVSGHLGIPTVARKRLYASDCDGTIKYYWICDVEDNQIKNREIDALQKIWADDNDIDPRNVIRLKETLHISPQLRKLVFALPSKPLPLSWPQILKNLTVSEREKIFHDAMRAISSLHDNYPPLYHRDITPEAFILCQSKNGYKLFLNDFDCVKDTDKNVQYTVGKKVADNMDKAKKQPYLAPEIRTLKDTDSEWKHVDWKKADIYALGMLGIFIITGTTDFHALQQVEDLSTHTVNTIANMIKPLDQRSIHV